MSLPTFFIPPSGISGGTAALSGDELRHARTTLRLGAGDAVRVVDGAGTSWSAVLGKMEREKTSLTLSDPLVEPPPKLDLTIAMGIVQGERFDWAIQKGTELGAGAFVPLVTERTEGRFAVPWKRVPRLGRVIVSACKQCGRARFPEISQPTALSDLELERYGLTVVFWEDAGGASLEEAARHLPNPGSCLMIIGPVGGLTAAEVDHLRDRGAVVSGMGPRILRTETAVAAGAVMLQYLWGDMG